MDIFKTVRAAGLGLGLWASLTACAQIAPPQLVRMEVDVSSSSPAPAVLRAGIFSFQPLPPEPALNEWLREMRPGLVEIDIGGPVFQQAVDSADVLRRAKALLPLLQRIRAAGGEPVLAITRIPLWLSTQPQATRPVEGDVVPKGSVVAPSDPQAWSALVAQVMGAVAPGLGTAPRIKVGWEPDQSAWQGSETDFFNFYRDTARGIKRGLPTARVGGPSVSALYNGKGGEGSEPMIPRFLRYCAETALPELGLRRLPVDFLIWHQFGAEPVQAWTLAALQVQAWLGAAGYSPQTDLIVGEWSSWLQWPAPQSPEHDLPALAAYIVASTVGMRDAGIHGAAFTSLTEQREVEGQPFIGSFGLYTSQFIKKPSYWAFAALAQLGDQQFTASSSEALVPVLAGRRSNREWAIVVATPALQARSVQRSLLAHALADGATLQQLQRELTASDVERLARGDMRPDQTRASPRVRKALEDGAQKLLPLVQRSQALGKGGYRIQIDLKGSLPANATLELWRIDSRHANPHALRERISTALGKRLAQEKQALGPGLSQRLNERGHSAEELEAFKAVMNARQREEALARHNPALRSTLRVMADTAQAYVHERLWAVGQEINAWPELAFGPDATGRQRLGPRIEFDMEGDAVVLVRIHNAGRP